MNEALQKKANEKSYKELLLGKRKDPTKDVRWHAVKGMGRRISTLSGLKLRAVCWLSDGQPVLHIINLCEQIPIIKERLEKLKQEIHNDEKEKVKIG